MEEGQGEVAKLSKRTTSCVALKIIFQKKFDFVGISFEQEL